MNRYLYDPLLNNSPPDMEPEIEDGTRNEEEVARTVIIFIYYSFKFNLKKSNLVIYTYYLNCNGFHCFKQ